MLKSYWIIQIEVLFKEVSDFRYITKRKTRNKKTEILNESAWQGKLIPPDQNVKINIKRSDILCDRYPNHLEVHVHYIEPLVPLITALFLRLLHQFYDTSTQKYTLKKKKEKTSVLSLEVSAFVFLEINSLISEVAL
jgi:hypothetical protein